MLAKATYALAPKSSDIADLRRIALCVMSFQERDFGLIISGIAKRRLCLSSERKPVHQDFGGTSRVELGPAHIYMLLVANHFVGRNAGSQRCEAV